MKPAFTTDPEKALNFATLHAAADLAMSTSTKSTTKRYRQRMQSRAVAQAVVNAANELLGVCLGRDWRELPASARERIASLFIDAVEDMVENGSSMNEALIRLLNQDGAGLAREQQSG